MVVDGVEGEHPRRGCAPVSLGNIPAVGRVIDGDLLLHGVHAQEGVMTI